MKNWTLTKGQNYIILYIKQRLNSIGSRQNEKIDFIKSTKISCKKITKQHLRKKAVIGISTINFI